MNSCDYNHASFWQRFLAYSIDSLSIILVAFVLHPLLNFTRESTAITTISIYLLTYVYFIITQNKYGKTLGKYIVKITVVSLSETFPSYLKLVCRYSVDIFLAIISVWIIVTSIFSISPEEYNNLPWLKQMSLAGTKSKNLATISVLIQLYLFFNVVWLIINSRNRAFHDILGGTLVVSDAGLEKNSVNEVNCNLDKIINKLEQEKP